MRCCPPWFLPLLATALAAQTPPDRPPRSGVAAPEVLRELERAARALAAGELAGAEAVLRTLTVNAPGMPTVWFQLGMVLRLRDQHAEALTAARRAVELAPGLLPARVLVVECQAELDPEQARPAARALLAEPEAIGLRRDLVPILLRLQAWPEVESTLAELVADAPEDMQLRQWQVECALGSGEPAKAVPALHRLLELEPRRPDVLESLANVHRVLDQTAAAITTFERLLIVDPSHTRGRQALIDLLVATGADAARLRPHREALARTRTAAPTSR